MLWRIYNIFIFFGEAAMAILDMSAEVRIYIAIGRISSARLRGVLIGGK